MKNTKYLVFLIILLLSFTEAFAQPDLNVFGFFQARLSQTKTFYSVDADIPTPMGTMRTNLDELNSSNLSSAVQQLNIFFRSELTDQFTAWVNLEFTNTYSSERNWGAFNLEEAWVKYNKSDAFNVKAGLLIPKFNYLNELKNKSPLLPYIIKPLVYEASLSSIIDISNYIPERAFVQLYGELISGDVNFEYAAYMGNAETDYILSDNSNGAMAPGSDSTGIDFKLFGGRVGLKYKDLSFGISATKDMDNQQETLGEDVPRFRIGADLEFSFANFFLDAEIISVNLSPKTTTDDINKLFYYGTVGYNFTDELFAFGTWSYLEDKQTDFLASGMKSLLIGGGYKPSYNVVIKAQYSSYYVDDGHFMIPIDPNLPLIQSDVQLDVDQYAVAVSILF